MTLSDPITDARALSDYAATQSPVAFAELVRRYVDLVYATARRMVADAHLAEDVTQAAFIVLAKKASRIDPPTLPGWLVTTTCLAARHALRTQRTRTKHESRAAAMRSTQTIDEPVADDLLPLLDDALAQLSDADRTAVVRRFLQGESFAQVAAAMSSTEEAARKRVGRAVEKLRSIFIKRGVAPSVGGLMVVLAAQQAKAAPAGVVAVATEVATPTAAGAGIAKGVTSTLLMGQAKTVLLALVLIAAVGGGAEVVRRAVATTPVTMPATVPATMPAPATQNVVAVNPAGVIAVGDLIDVAVGDLVGVGMMSDTLVDVEADGTVPLQLARPVKVAGLTNDRAAAAVAAAYHRANVIDKAVVTVTIVQRAAESDVKPIAVGQTLAVGIGDLEAPNKTTKVSLVVSAAGTITPPMVKPVKVAGLTETEAIGALQDAYEAARIMRQAAITVVRTNGPLPVAPAPMAVIAPATQPVIIQSPDTPLTAGDLVEVSVDGMLGPRMRFTFPGRVDLAGNLAVQDVGEVHVAGLMAAEAGAALLTAYRRAKMELDGPVAVTVVTPAAAMAIPPGPFAIGDTARVFVGELISPQSFTEVHAVVAADGTIELPLAGAVKIAGLTEFQAVAAIRKAYADAKVVDHAMCMVIRTGSAR